MLPPEEPFIRSRALRERLQASKRRRWSSVLVGAVALALGVGRHAASGQRAKRRARRTLHLQQRRPYYAGPRGVCQCLKVRIGDVVTRSAPAATAVITCSTAQVGRRAREIRADFRESQERPVRGGHWTRYSHEAAIAFRRTTRRASAARRLLATPGVAPAPVLEDPGRSSAACGADGCRTA